MDSVPDTKLYIKYMDEFIIQLKNEIDSLSSKKVNPDSGQTSDKYILDLNSFYYESFQRTFFPRYKQIIEDDIRSLYHISKQEDTLKKDIITSFKQHARLFNRVKVISSLLKHKRQEINPSVTSSSKGSDKRNVELLYILKDFANIWNTFLTLVQNLQILLDDKKLLNALNQYPAHAVINNLIHEWEPENSKSSRELNRLMAAWQLAVKLLVKLQETPLSGKDSYWVVGRELEDVDISWDNRKVPPTLRSWYKQYIQKTFRLYLERLSLYGDRNASKHIVQAAGQFEDWLSSLLYVLEQSLSYQSRGWGDLLSNTSLLTRLDEDYLKELSDYSKRTLQAMDELIEGLSDSTQANYQFHSQRSNQIFAVALQYLKLQKEKNISSKGIILAPEIDRLIAHINMLEFRIEFLDEKEEFFTQTAGQYQLIIDSIDSYLELLGNIKEELEQLLAPRNIKRNFQDINLRVEHIAISKGAPFPSDYYYLIDKKAVETQVTVDPDGRILYEEGDIFIIHVDDLKEEEIPKIIIAKKG